MQRLPDAEFELMKLIWKCTPPVTSGMLLAILPDGIEWKAQTVLTLLGRMEKRGFVISEKQGKERLYCPLITAMAYMAYEAELLTQRYEKTSFLNLVGTLYKGKKLKGEDILELEQWLKEKSSE